LLFGLSLYLNCRLHAAAMPAVKPELGKERRFFQVAR
jgi:hypothetical protein